MPTTEKLRNKLMTKLTELFQLDQPDLDFGFYRIMQAKAQQVKSFIDNDLLQIIEGAFGEMDEEKKRELSNAYDKAVKTAKEYGAPNPEETEAVKQAKAALDALNDNVSAEADVYDHLYRFFERYYEEGDFISRRYYARENAGKAAPYAIPYNGEEVKLHWANADQYYIKTSEYFSNFSFDIAQAAEIARMSDNEKAAHVIPKKALKIHFRILDASEGEHGNVKSSDDKKRFFVLHEETPVEMNDANELVVNFEYKALPGGKNDVDADTEKALKEKYKASNKGDMPNLAIAEKIIEALENPQITQMNADEEAKKEICENLRVSADTYLSALKLAAPTDKIPNRPLLAKYINRYTARNTCDYFIHKDLGGFLKRELDFYIKNEVMYLDDIENADAPAVETYLAKLKVIRKIATKLIDFLAQLENFQKKLWLKKKFVTETNYCITLDRVPEELYPQIVENKEQIQEWVTLGFIEEKSPQITQKDADIFGDNLRESVPPADTISVEVLKANDKLVLDTAFFSADFKATLIASIEDFDEQCDGLLIHSENFQALNLLQERYREQVKCVYIDPPYNAQSSEILYKNSYKHSSWLSLMLNRVEISKNMLRNDFVYITAIDEVENMKLGIMYENVFLGCENATVSIVHNPTGQQGNNFSFTHEFAHFVYPQNKPLIGLEDREDDLREAKPDIRPLRNVSSGKNHLRESAANCFYPIYVKNSEIVGFGDVCPDNFHPEKINIVRKDGVVEVYPIDPSDVESKWVFARDTVESIVSELTAEFNSKKGHWDIIRKKTKFRYKSLWSDKRYSANSWGSVILNKILPNNPFTYPKSVYTVMDCIDAGMTNQIVGEVMDFFGGSGTTGQAVLELNRKNNGKLKYNIVEMGDYFDTVTKPRITKVIYSSDWKNGKPVPSKNNLRESAKSADNKFNGISHCFKYIRLESYEDTLNNLVFDDNPVRAKALTSNPDLFGDYMLRYLLDVETRGSQSLLNIDAFADPTAYKLKVKKPGSDEQVTQNIDLIETFNYLIGLRLENMAAPQTFTASFTRKPDPELPEDQHTKLVVDGTIKQINPQITQMDADEKAGKNNLRESAKSVDKHWWFRKVEGRVPADPRSPNNGRKERVLIVWRKLTGNLEEDNLMLDEWFEKYRISTRDFEYDTIYVNGSNNLPNLKKDDEDWKVRLIEEEFHKRMWEMD